MNRKLLSLARNRKLESICDADITKIKLDKTSLTYILTVSWRVLVTTSEVGVFFVCLLFVSDLRQFLELSKL